MKSEFITNISKPEEFSKNVAENIIKSISSTLDNQERCRVSLAGGSTPAAIYSIIAKDSSVDWSKVDFFYGDERWVSHDDDLSNYKMSLETFLSSVGTDSGIYPYDTSLESISETSSSYESTIRSVFGMDTGIPEFDLMLLGMGADGHTASLFPRNVALESKSLCTPVDLGTDNVSRISFTIPLIQAAKNIFCIVSGKAKSQMVQNIFETEGEIREYPVRILKEVSSRVTWFLDSESSSLI